jgi:hypothetical protein
MTPTTRALAFFCLCIPSRLLLAYGAKELPTNQLQLLGLIVGAIAFTTLFLFFSGSRLEAGEGGGVTWWANFRLLHGYLLLAGATYLLRKDRRAVYPLVADVAVGILLFFTLRK